MNEATNFTLTEAAKILGVSRDFLTSERKKKRLIPDGKIGSSGKTGFSFVFSRETILEYAKKRGIDPIFENVNLKTPKKHKPNVSSTSERYFYTPVAFVIKNKDKYVKNFTPSSIEFVSDISDAQILGSGVYEYTKGVFEELGFGEIVPLYVRTEVK